uniref:NADH-ubiquinone oxidoreductase chain 2 n=1 Tax=Rhopalaea idoneta TaxID=1712670 RepID=A0A173QSY2_9ASCI|nr:NADH dehydrogenase subunit 2 [Rhopalaea idoneta]
MFIFFFIIFPLFSLGFFIIFSFTSLIMLWVGMELISFSIVLYLFTNFSFVDLLGFSSITKGKIIFKYFIIQMVGAVVILFFLIYSQFFFFTFFFYFSLFFFAVKLGIFPGHMWVTELYGTLTFSEMFVVGVVPKVAPLLFFSFYAPIDIFFFLGFFSIFFSVSSALKFSSIRHVISFSSIMNIGWLVFSLSISLKVFFLVFFFYILLSFSLYIFFMHSSFFSLFSPFFRGVDFFSVKMLMGGLLFGIMGAPLSVMFFFKIFIIAGNYNFFFFFFVLFFNSVGVVFYGRMLYFFMLNSQGNFFTGFLSVNSFFFVPVLLSFFSPVFYIFI